MKVHVLQHVPFEGIGSMASWLADRGASVEYTRFFESGVLPEIDDLDLVISMGGPMSVNDEKTLPWLVQEKLFVRETVRRGIPTVGVCLGAQLIASALGARVYPNRQKEIGWFEIRKTNIDGDVFAFPEKATVFHWHGETFDLPDGAVCLAKSEACDIQAFQIGKTAMGLQFHLETTPESAAAIVENCREELVPGPYVQSEAALLAAPESNYRQINRLMEKVLSYITGA